MIIIDDPEKLLITDTFNYFCVDIDFKNKECTAIYPHLITAYYSTNFTNILSIHDKEVKKIH